MRDAGRRIAASLAIIGGATALVSAVAALLLGSSVLRAVATGLYLVGSFFIVLGTFAGIRGPLRSSGADEQRGSTFGGLLGLGILGGRVRNATRDERVDAISTAWLFLGLGVALVLLGVAVDDRTGFR
jgi:hypothetical protein